VIFSDLKELNKKESEHVHLMMQSLRLKKNLWNIVVTITDFIIQSVGCVQFTVKERKQMCWLFSYGNNKFSKYEKKIRKGAIVKIHFVGDLDINPLLMSDWFVQHIEGAKFSNLMREIK